MRAGAAAAATTPRRGPPAAAGGLRLLLRLTSAPPSPPRECSEKKGVKAAGWLPSAPPRGSPLALRSGHGRPGQEEPPPKVTLD